MQSENTKVESDCPRSVKIIERGKMATKKW